MSIQATSVKRTQASSAQSGTAVAIYTGSNSISVAGAVVSSSTQVSLGLVTPGTSSSTSTVTVAGGPSISTIQYLDTNNAVVVGEIAVNTAGGNILINGSGFVTGSNVYVNNTLVSNTFISSSQIRAILPSASVGNVTVMVFTPTNVGSFGPNVRYSGAPSWTTSAASFVNGTAANVSLVATSDSTLTYTLQAGSSLPTGISLVSSGYLSGTPTGYSNTATSTAVIIATDLEGQATQQTISWTVQVGEPQFYLTTLLLNGDTGSNAINAATNNTFLDSTANNYTVTRVGTATQGTFSPYSQTGWSNYFNGSTDYFTLPVSANLAFAGDYTIEAWVYLNSVTGLQGVYSSIDNSADTWQGPYLGFSGTSFLATSYISGPDVITHQTTVAIGQWYHIAMCRSGNTTKSYLNGVQSTGTTTSTYSLTQSGSTIGSAYPGTSPLNGYISNLRIIKGTALYTSNFTPPTAPLTAVANTQLLTCQSNRFNDKSSNALAITSAGTPSVQAFSPFAPGVGYSASTVGGSIYCDGASGYVTVANNANFNITSGSTDSFVCEFWVNFDTVGASMSIVDNGGLNGVSFQNWSIGLDASSIFQLVWGNSAAPGSQIGILSGTSVAKTGRWYHVALVKTNADWALFINGVRETSYNGLNTAAKTSTSALYIGYGIGTGAGGTRFKGYISNLRIYKGATAGAPYAATSTTITVPTSLLTEISGTTLLLNGANGGIVDAHSGIVCETVGDTKLSTAVKKYGSASIAFDGTGDWLQFPSTSQTLAFGTGDFTVECWVYFAANNGTYNPFIRYDGSGTFDFGYDFSTSQLKYQSATAILNVSQVFTTGTWYHVAATRSSGNSRLFVNGTQIGTTATGDTNNYASGAFKVGGSSYSGSHVMNGYIDDLRITKGFARYTANFTAPTSAFIGQ